MILKDPQSRIAFGNIVQAGIVLILVGFIGWIIKLFDADANHLWPVAMALCVIVGLYVSGIIAENVGRIAVKAGKDGVEGDIGGGNAGS